MRMQCVPGRPFSLLPSKKGPEHKAIPIFFLYVYAYMDEATVHVYFVYNDVVWPVYEKMCNLLA